MALAEVALAEVAFAGLATAGLATVKPTLARLTMVMSMVNWVMARRRDSLVQGDDGLIMRARCRRSSTGPDQGVGKDCWNLAG